MDLETLSPAACTSEGVSSFGRGPTAVFRSPLPHSREAPDLRGRVQCSPGCAGVPKLLLPGRGEVGLPCPEREPPSHPRQEGAGQSPTNWGAEPVDGACRH